MANSQFDKYVKELDDIIKGKAKPTKKELELKDILYNGFHTHILDRKRQYWEEEGEGLKLYNLLLYNTKNIEYNTNSCNRGNPKKCTSFVTKDIDAIFEYNNFQIKVKVTEARSGNKRYTIDVYSS